MMVSAAFPTMPMGLGPMGFGQTGAQRMRAPNPKPPNQRGVQRQPNVFGPRPMQRAMNMALAYPVLMQGQGQRRKRNAPGAMTGMAMPNAVSLGGF